MSTITAIQEINNYKNVFPSRNTINLDEFEFNSNFCNGNLFNVIQYDPRTFRIFNAPDNKNRPFEAKSNAWFYFSLKGVRAGETLVFILDNVNGFTKLQGDGFKPVCKSAGGTWHPVPATPVLGQDNNHYLKFEHTFQSAELHQFAFCEPFSQDDCCQMLQNLENKQQNSEEVQFHRSTLCKTVEGRDMEVVTISSQTGIQSQHEDFNSYSKNQPLAFQNKKQCIISARVHPGEVTGQHAFLGLMEKILADDYHGKTLRDNFVFKLIPMINPDGVARGHWRFDALGENLNRFQNNPNKNLHPNCWQIRELAEKVGQKGQFYFQMDFHSHATKKGCFVYGNFMDYWDAVQCQYFAKLVSLNSVNFDFTNSLFAEKMMSVKDKHNLSREGAGRVGVWKVTKSPLCYTLECNYYTGVVFNNVAAWSDEIQDQEQRQRQGNKLCSNQDSFQKSPNPFFDSKVFKDVGAGVAVALLDQAGKNEINRVRKSDYKSNLNVQDLIAKKVIETIPYRLDKKMKDAAKILISEKDYKFFNHSHASPEKRVRFDTESLLADSTHEIKTLSKSPINQNREQFSIEEREEPIQVNFKTSKNTESINEKENGSILINVGFNSKTKLTKSKDKILRHHKTKENNENHTEVSTNSNHNFIPLQNQTSQSSSKSKMSIMKQKLKEINQNTNQIHLPSLTQDPHNQQSLLINDNSGRQPKKRKSKSVVNTQIHKTDKSNDESSSNAQLPPKFMRELKNDQKDIDKVIKSITDAKMSKDDKENQYQGTKYGKNYLTKYDSNFKSTNYSEVPDKPQIVRVKKSRLKLIGDLNQINTRSRSLENKNILYKIK